MNYLKKKIRAHKKAIENDEDYGDYVPEVPPHPDDLLRNQQNLASPFAVNNDFFIKSPQAEQQPSAAAAGGGEPSQPQPKVIRKAKEEKEEWQWFNSLTARVQQTVAKTEKEIEKIKATTKVDEIEAKTEPEYYFTEQLENLNQQFEEKFSSLETEKKRSKKNEIKSPSVALNLTEKLKSSTSNQQIVSPTTNQAATPTSLKSIPASLSQTNLTRKNVVASTTSQWIGFNRDSVDLLDDEDDEEERLLREQEEKERLAKEQEEEERKRVELIKQKLAAQFGFVEPSLNAEHLNETGPENEDQDEDPFDTEYAEKKYESTKDLTSKIEKLEKELSNTHLNLIKPTTLDLSGSPAKQIDRTTSSQCIKDYSRASNKYSSVPCTPGDKVDPDEIDILTTLQTGRLSRYNSKESLALSETLVSRTNSVQSIHSLLSNQSRRSSTNPFDIETSALDDNAEGEDVPNVIAALTEEFTKTIGNLDKEKAGEHEKREVPKAESVQSSATVDEQSKEEESRAAKLIEANEAAKEEQIHQEAEEFDNDLNKVDDELSQEVIVNRDYIVEEVGEDDDRAISEKEEEFNQRQAIGDSGELEIDISDSAEHPEELQFDELGNLKGSVNFNQLVAEPEYSEEDIEEVQNFIKEQIPFDPFETIVEDEPTASNSNRQSVSSPNDLSASNSLNKQNSIDKDSAFKDNVPSNKDDLTNSDLNKSDLNNNNDSKAANQPATAATKISVSSDQSLVIDEQQLTNEYFDPFRTVNDLTPTSEVFGGDQPSDTPQGQQPLPQPPQQSYLENEEEDLPLPPPDLIEPDLEPTADTDYDMGDNQEDVNLEDLPPPPPELTSPVDDDEEVQQAVISEDLQQQSDSSKAEQEDEKQMDTSAVPETVDESEEQDKEAEMETEESGPFKEVEKEVVVEPSRLDLEINPDEIITSEELSNLVADPFDTTIYEYDTLKSFIPVASKDQIEEFNEKFETKQENDTNSSTYLDPFKSPLPQRRLLGNKKDEFDTFDPFQTTRPPKNTPVLKRKQVKKAKSTSDSDEEEEGDGEDSSDFSSSDDEKEKLRFVIRARIKEDIENQENIVIPMIPGPPQTPTKSPKHQLRGVYDKPLLQVGRNRAKLREEYKRIHKKSLEEAKEDDVDLNMYANIRKKYEEEHPEAAEEAPLFEEDTTELEEYENPFENLEWNFYVRYPIKKKITGNRFWKLATVKFLPAINTVQLFNYVPKNKKQEVNPEDCAEPPVSEDTTGEPLQELLLQGSYGVSEIASQQYDEFGKIFTIKVQYKFYREKVGADTGKKIAHNMKIIQGKLANFSKKFNDVVNVNVNNIVDLTNKDNLLVSMAMLQHTPQITELFKFGSHNYGHLKQFKAAIEQTLFKMPVARDRALTYRAEEMQVQMQDEYYCELNTAGIVQYHKARVRLFLLSFLNGNPVVEIGINDRTREGKEVVGRNDIMPISTEEWIRVEDVQFHHCVEASAFQADDKLVKLVPPDACTIEVMRFRVRPSRNRELPLIVSARMILNPRKVELRIEAMAAGAVSKKRDSDVIPCEDIVIRVHIPEEWIYFFRMEKHTRFGSVKSASRRPGKLKGIERILGATTNIQLEASLLEASAGQAKYEHAFHSLVWRIPRLPKEGQGAYRQQTMVMKLPLTESFDKIPENIDDNVFVEYRMPTTVVSHAVVRSISISQSDSETPPEKYAAYVSRVDYKLKMSIEHEDEMNAYNAVTASAIKKQTIQETPIEEKDSDDDIDYDDEEDDVDDE